MRDNGPSQRIAAGRDEAEMGGLNRRAAGETEPLLVDILLYLGVFVAVVGVWQGSGLWSVLWLTVGLAALALGTWVAVSYYGMSLGPILFSVGATVVAAVLILLLLDRVRRSSSIALGLALVVLVVEVIERAAAPFMRRRNGSPTNT